MLFLLIATGCDETSKDEKQHACIQAVDRSTSKQHVQVCVVPFIVLKNLTHIPMM